MNRHENKAMKEWNKKEFEIKTKTDYFGKKNAIYRGIRYFESFSDKTNVTFNVNGKLVDIKKQAIVNYLGYDFTKHKDMLEKEKTQVGKLYHKKSILKLFDLVNGRDKTKTSTKKNN